MSEGRKLQSPDEDNITVSTVLTIDDDTPQIALPHHFNQAGHRMDAGNSTRTHHSGFVNPAYETEETEDSESGSYETETGSEYTDGSTVIEGGSEVGLTPVSEVSEQQNKAESKDSNDSPHEDKVPSPPPPAQYIDPPETPSDSQCPETSDSKSVHSVDHLEGAHSAPPKRVQLLVPTTESSKPPATKFSQRIKITEDDYNLELETRRPIVPMPGKHPAVLPPAAYHPPKLQRKMSKTHMHTVVPPEEKQNDFIIPMQGEVTYTQVSETAYKCPVFDEMTTYEASPPLSADIEMPDYSHTEPKPKKEHFPDLDWEHPFGEDLPSWDEITIKDIRENTDLCCSCCLYCFRGKLTKVTPEQVASARKTITAHCDLTHSPEFAPPEGRKLFFEDGERRIDFVLAWTEDKDSEKEEDRARARSIFERNLEEEGLDLEHDVRDDHEVKYLKVHAPWEVLTRYAEIMKIRMPMKEIPSEVQSQSFLEMMSDYMAKFLSPFELDPAKVPPIPKKFTCAFERDKEYLFAIPKKKELFFSHGTRSRIVDYILRRKRYSDDKEDNFAFGIKRLLSTDVYTSAYPLHEGSWKTYTKPSMRRLLYEHWARWANFYKVQPLDYVRVYFGEKVGLYFAWLGYYTYVLIPASIIGLLVFIYGCATISTNIVAQESCDVNNNFTMCPKCDRRCPYWNYASVCGHVEASHMFDNGATVFFAIFMSFWGTFFLEFWKREQAGIQFQWNLMGFEEEEEPPRPEYLVKLSNSKHTRTDKVTGIEEPYMPFCRRQLPVYITSITIMLFLCLVAVAVVTSVIIYRMAVLSALYLQDEELLYQNASMVASATAAIFNLIAIFILNFIYSRVAVKLTDWECPRTQSEYESSLTFKLYTLQFVNYYSSLFYIAFFKGRFTGRPGDYRTVLGARQEECSGGGCLMELCIQLAVIFVGKQLIQNNLIEILLPRVMRTIKGCFSDEKDVDKSKMMPWEKDYLLIEPGQRALFHEYLEMLLQFGFVTIFVAAFPLAPLFAWLNNIIEIRADADKFVTQYKRPLALRAETIGVWYQLLFAVSRLSVLTNAFIIAVTSGFIHRLVYSIEYSEDGSLRGYVNYTLSYFNVSHFDDGVRPDDPEGKYNSVEICRYRDYREPPWDEDMYEYTATFWHVVAAQFIFVVIFENVVIVTTNLIAFIIPDMPHRLKEQVRREAYLTNEIIIKTELDISHGEDGVLTEEELRRIRRRVTAGVNRSPNENDLDGAGNLDGAGDHPKDLTDSAV